MPGTLPRTVSASPSDTREQLTAASVALHWLVALAVIAMLGFGVYLSQIERGDAKSALIQIHKSFGALVLFLVMARVWWRVRQGPLQPVGDHAKWEQRLAKASHTFLLFATVAMPLTGFVRSIGRGRSIDIFGMPFIPQLLAEKNDMISAAGSLAHEVIAYATIAVLALHATAALKHQLIDRDGTLWRMLGRRVT